MPTNGKIGWSMPRRAKSASWSKTKSWKIGARRWSRPCRDSMFASAGIFEAPRPVEDPIALGMLAHEFGVSGERVRQIEARAFEKGQKAVQHRVAAIEQSERGHHGPQAVSHAAQFAA
jgi:Sigma-70, region 4